MLDKKIAEKMGYEESFPVSGQTYPRKLDSQMLKYIEPYRTECVQVLKRHQTSSTLKAD